MNTIKRLAELARSTSKGLWHYGAYAVEDDDGRIICNMSGWKNEAQTRRNGEYIAACNPAAIAKAHAEYAELERRNAELVYALGRVAKGRLCFQLQAVTDLKCLDADGRMAMAIIGDYAQPASHAKQESSNEHD